MFNKKIEYMTLAEVSQNSNKVELAKVANIENLKIYVCKETHKKMSESEVYNEYENYGNEHPDFKMCVSFFEFVADNFIEVC